MKNIIPILCLFSSALVLGQSAFIHVDQFGYGTSAPKVAVLSNPYFGANAGFNYSPPASLELKSHPSGTVEGNFPVEAWKNGLIDTIWSGDQGWWVDFSSFNQVGNFYLSDPINQEDSPVFSIGEDVYTQPLKDATRMFYYNRCNHSKEAPFAEANWVDANSNFNNALQDANCRYIYDPSNASLEKDLSGGWFDAGDYNKYVTFTMSTIHNLLWAYRENADVFTDNNNIPESGNGIPDLIDEIKWELDWLLKMCNPDGSVHIKMGSQNYAENVSFPPSNNFDQRFYGPTCTSASLAVASVFAHAATVLSAFPSLSAYANTLSTQAETCWDYLLPYYNSNTLELDCDDGSIVAGDADYSAAQYQEGIIAAAIYLFEQTGDASYNTFIENNYLNSVVFGPMPNDPNDPLTYEDDWWDINYIEAKDAFLHYATLTGNSTSVADDFTASFQAMVNNNWEGFLGFSDKDLYRAYLPSYFLGWGSNQSEGIMGMVNLLVNKYGVDNGNPDSYSTKASGHLHYLHGVNPLGKCHLSNMYDRGAERCADEIYHSWFQDGSIYDNALSSTNGPAPGFLSGGANHTYSGPLSPPGGEPYLKAYADINDVPSIAWEITEPAIYYQAAYVRLLANIMAIHTPNNSTGGPNPIYAGDLDWKTLKTGAGGWITGMHIHPSGNLMLARSDVGGAYKYNATNNEWEQIVTAQSIPSTDHSFLDYQGVLSLVSAPSDDQVLYLAHSTGIYKSTDQGISWTKTNFPSTEMPANDDSSKYSGERLSVDPINSELVYFGSINDGLWESTDGGNTWTQITGVPNGAIDRGVRTVLFDLQSGTSNNQTQTLYAIVDGEGIFKSVDGGNSWNDISPVNYLVNGIAYFYDAEIDNQGVLYLVGETYDSATNNFTSFGLIRYDGSQWSQPYTDNFPMGEVALDPFNSERVFLFSEGYTEIYRTTNISSSNPTWDYSTDARSAANIPWMSWSFSEWFVLGEVQFDPVIPGKLWIADGIGTWSSTDLDDAEMTWDEQSAGQEHLVSNDAVALPDGKAVTLHWDRPIFHHDDVDQYPTLHQPSSRFNSSWSIDQFPTDPDYLVAIIEDHRYCCYDNDTRSSGYSIDGGLSWTKFASMPEPGNSNLIFGEIAVSANDKDNIIWLPVGNRMPYYTTDRGNTWTQVTLPNNSGNCCLTAQWFQRKALTADRVLPNTFYIYDWGDGSIFKSSDGGQSWVKYNQVVSELGYNAKLLSVPGQAGHLLFANGPEEDLSAIEGLSYSQDGGQSWTTFTNTDMVLNVAVGKAAPSASYPTFFIQGEVNGVFGYFKSEDQGLTWSQIGMHPGGIYDWAKVMVGDINNYERLYVGFKGNGFMYYGDDNTTTINDPHLEAVSSYVEIFPNPVDQYFVLQGELWLYDIEIINDLGQVVQNIISSNTEEVIDTSSFGPGMYFIKVTNQSNNAISVQKIIKQ